MSDNELGTFLRSRRAAVTPAVVGLPPGTRRRTPGLRRSELATLAGISVEYLTRLEQGHDRRPSPQVLTALADALRLTTEERIYLRNVAKASDGGGTLCVGAEPPTRAVRPNVQALLNLLEPAPAALMNRLSDVLACTDGYRRLTSPVGLLDTEPANLLRFVFADPRAREAFPDWERVADQQTAVLRAAQTGYTDPYAEQFVEELRRVGGPAFADRYSGPPLVPTRTGTVRLRHPEVGELRLTYEMLDLLDIEDERLVVYLAGDEVSAAALDQLTGRRPGALRAVPGRTAPANAVARRA